jgi:hypothetical protein
MRIDPVKLQARVNYWRKLFQLGEMWDIRVHIVKAEEPIPEDAKDAAGTCEPDSSYFQADVTFYEAHIHTASDMDEVVCHELLHIVFDPLEIAAKSSLGPSHDSLSDMLVESTIERLSRAFCVLARRKRHVE